MDIWRSHHRRARLPSKYYAEVCNSICLEGNNLPSTFGICSLSGLSTLPRIRGNVDNGKVYLSRHLLAILVELRIKRVRHPPYQAYCKGKIEAANKIIKNQFQREAQVAGIRTIDELNSAFWAWMDLEYNTRVLSATGQSPDARFADGLAPEQRRITDLDSFNALFLWRARRTVSKYGRIKLHGNQYPAHQRRPWHRRRGPLRSL